MAGAGHESGAKRSEVFLEVRDDSRNEWETPGDNLRDTSASGQLVSSTRSFAILANLAARTLDDIDAAIDPVPVTPRVWIAELGTSVRLWSDGGFFCDYPGPDPTSDDCLGRVPIDVDDPSQLTFVSDSAVQVHAQTAELRLFRGVCSPQALRRLAARLASDAEQRDAVLTLDELLTRPDMANGRVAKQLVIDAYTPLEVLELAADDDTAIAVTPAVWMVLPGGYLGLRVVLLSSGVFVKSDALGRPSREPGYFAPADIGPLDAMLLAPNDAVEATGDPSALRIHDDWCRGPALRRIIAVMASDAAEVGATMTLDDLLSAPSAAANGVTRTAVESRYRRPPRS